jgi:hypothetical protein
VWARHVGTGLLFVGGSLFLVVFPFWAIVETWWLFVLLVVGGIAVAFICSASELAFALACGEGVDSDLYRRNLDRVNQLYRVAQDATRPAEEQAAASREAERVGLLVRIGESYSSRHNPTLVVMNNVANIVVAVVSTFAVFAEAQPQRAGQTCPSPLLTSFRCSSIFLGHPWLPFPVNSELFQSALALTLILVLGEMIPKQLGTAFPERTTHICFPIYRSVAFLSFGTGPSFGAGGRFVVLFVRQLPIWWAAAKKRFLNARTMVVTHVVDLRDRLWTSAGLTWRSLWNAGRTFFSWSRERLCRVAKWIRDRGRP